MSELPTQTAFLSAAKRYDAIALSCTLLSDYDTPSSVFKKLAADYLLESVVKGESVGRYSIIGVGERIRMTLHGTSLVLREERLAEEGCTQLETIRAYTNPLDFVRAYFLSLRMPPSPPGGPFSGGLLGYLGYEAVQYFEAVAVGKDELGVPDGLMVLPRLVAVYDSIARTLRLSTLVLTRLRRSRHTWVAAARADSGRSS